MPNTNDFYSIKPKNNEKNKRLNRLKRPGTFILIIVVIILLMGLTFEISKIDVKGNNLYSNEDVISASGIRTGDNLFFLNRIAAGSRVVVKLPYIDAVSITRTLPNKVTIIVQESSAIGYVEVDGEYWTVSQSGKYLAKIEAEDAKNIAMITGLTLKNPVVGEGLKVPKDETGKLEYLKEIMHQIQTRGIVADITAIDMRNEANPDIGYQDRFTVRLGELDNTEYKFGKMLSAIEQLGADDSGTMDLSTDDKVYFNPN